MKKKPVPQLVRFEKTHLFKSSHLQFFSLPLLVSPSLTSLFLRSPLEVSASFPLLRQLVIQCIHLSSLLRYLGPEDRENTNEMRSNGPFKVM